MATIKFQLRGKKNPANITVRLSAGRGKIFRAKTGYSIDPEKWNTETNLPKQGGDESQKNLKTDLQNLATGIEEKLNEATKTGIEISGDWLQQQINSKQGKVKTTEHDRLTNCIQAYIDYLPRKKQRKGKRGVSLRTIMKHKSLKVKIENFEAYRKKKILVKDVGLKFIEELEKYLYEVDKLGDNTTGSYIKFLKTVCVWAQNKKGIPAHKELQSIEYYSDEAAKVVLTFDELETVENTTLERSALENAKDWLIIGCYIGQRVSDLLILTDDNITARNGIELIELTQKKTGKRVAIPLHPKVKTILDKRNGKFPYHIPDQKFNKHIKDVCKEAGIDEPTKGAILKDIDEANKTIKQKDHRWRKVFGIYPKHELITTHVCRRSYATNFFGEIPTSLLMKITAHSTEKQFLTYVGKSEIDTAQQIAEFYAKQALLAKKEPQMELLKQAI